MKHWSIDLKHVHHNTIQTLKNTEKSQVWDRRKYKRDLAVHSISSFIFLTLCNTAGKF